MFYINLPTADRQNFSIRDLAKICRMDEDELLSACRKNKIRLEEARSFANNRWTKEFEYITFSEAVRLVDFLNAELQKKYNEETKVINAKTDKNFNYAEKQLERYNKDQAKISQNQQRQDIALNRMTSKVKIISTLFDGGAA